jgi:hypothetical protein
MDRTDTDQHNSGEQNYRGYIVFLHLQAAPSRHDMMTETKPSPMKLLSEVLKKIGVSSLIGEVGNKLIRGDAGDQIYNPATDSFLVQQRGVA